MMDNRQQQRELKILEQRQKEEMELLSLQSELTQKNSQLRMLEGKYAHLEKNFKYILENHKAIIGQIDALKQEVELEKKKNLELDSELQLAKIENAKIIDVCFCLLFIVSICE